MTTTILTRANTFHCTIDEKGVPYPECVTMDTPPAYIQDLDERVDQLNLAESATESRAQQMKPIVIPQTTTTFMNRFLFPFARAYPEQLAELGLDERQFLSYLDGLNETFMASPIFRILGTVGRIASFNPMPIVMGAGVGLSVVSGFAGAGVSYARTRAYVKKHNKEVFGPMGLRVRIISTAEMLKTVTGDENGKKLHLPPLPACNESWDPTSASTDPRLRRLEAVQDHVARLRWNVIPADTPDNMLKKMGAWQAQKSQAKAQKRHEKMCRKVSRKNEKAMRKDKPKKLAKAEKARSKAERKEATVNSQILWIVIVPASSDED